MTGAPHISVRKRVADKVSRSFKHVERRLHQPKQSQAPNQPPSTSPSIAQSSGQQPHVRSVDGVFLIEAPAASGRIATHGQMEPSSASQTTKVIVKGILGLLSSAADGVPIPGVKGIFETIIKVIRIMETTQANEEGFKEIETRCQTLLDKVIIPLRGKPLSDIPPALMASLKGLESDLSNILADIEMKQNLGNVNHTVNHEEYAVMIRSMDDQISHFMENYSANINTWTAMMVHQVYQAQQIQAKTLLEQKLRHVNAGYDHRSSQPRSSCFAGTREKLLTEIKSWIHDPTTDKPIFVLYGIAGIGKSTVAQTVAEYAASKKLLLASFFFSRAENQCKSGDYFFSTLAFQLSCYHEDLATIISQALEAMPDILQKNLNIQFQQLIVEPIKKARVAQEPLVLVIDAFDECLSTDAKDILELLGAHIQSMPNVKIFITTRPESHIQRTLVQQGQLKPFYLHEIETSVAKGDIDIFLKFALSKEEVKKALPFTAWEPTHQELESLVEKCGILFIMASTAVKYILDDGLSKPSQQMDRLCNGLDVTEGDDGVTTSLDKMYLGILRSSVPTRAQTEYLANFQKVVGAIVVLEDPLPMPSLSNLLEMETLDVQITLQKLHSIMAPTSSNQAPQLYHKSFPDFIADSSRCVDPNFHINPQKHHAQLAHLCFSLMEKNLHQNMQGVQGLDIYKANIELGDRRARSITNELKYACTYWATHLKKAGPSNFRKLLSSLKKFAFTHLLHWIEALSLCGKLDVVYPAVKAALHLLTQLKNPKELKLIEILNDGSRCVTKFYETIRRSGSHVYHSALPFMPVVSQIYKVYNQDMMNITTVLGGDIQWNPLLASLEGHQDGMAAIAFSPDGSRLASSSLDKTVRLWNGLTGAHITTLEDHSGVVGVVTFSDDGSRLASGSHDKTVKLWDGLTGASIATLDGHLDKIRAVVFLRDGFRLASGSDDRTAKLWDTLKGSHIATIKGHSKDVSAIAFSPDGSRLALASGSINLWNVLTGAHTATATVGGHSAMVGVIAFSSDGLRLASGSSDKTVQLWDGLTGVHITTLEGHSDWVTAVAFSFNGYRLASGSHDNTTKLWNGITGAHIATLRGHSGTVRSVAFSPNGSRLASGSHDNTVKLWDGLTGVHIATLRGHSGIVNTVVFSYGGSRLVSGSGDTTINIWDGFQGAHIATLKGRSGWVTTVAVSSNSLRLASGDINGDIQLWNSVTGAHIITLRGHSSWVRVVTFSSDNHRLASGSNDKTIKLWNGHTGAHIATLEGHSGCVNTVAFSCNGDKLASGSDDGTVRLWDGHKGTHITTLKGHSDWVTAVAFSSNGYRLASGSVDKTVTIWDSPTGAKVTSDLGRVEVVAFSYDGSRLASGSVYGTINLWDGHTGAHIITLVGHSTRVMTLGFSIDGTRLASGSHDKTVKLWNGIIGACIVTLEGHSGAVTSVAFSSDGSRLASGSHDNTVKLWDGLTGVHIATLRGHSGIVTMVAFSSDGSRLASGSDDKTVKLWNGLTRDHIVTREVHSGWVTTVAFSSDGSRMASGSHDKTVKLWNALTGAHIANLKGHSGMIRIVVFSSNGSRLASGSLDNTVKLWNGITGVHLATLKGHSGMVGIVAFSYDGSRLASGSGDKTIRLWNGFTGALIATLVGHTGRVITVAFSSDGYRLASGSSDKTVRLWNGLTGTYITTLEGHSGNVNAVSFSYDTSRLASGSDDKTVKLWQGHTGHHIATLEGHSAWVKNVTFLSDEFSVMSLLTTTDNKGIIKYWDWSTGLSLPNFSFSNITGASSGSDITSLTIPSHAPGVETLSPGTATKFGLSSMQYRYVQESNTIQHVASSTTVLWLPSEFGNPCIFSFHSHTIAMGYQNGRVIIIHLPKFPI